MKVLKINTRNVKTRFGEKPTYSAQMDDGVWYSCGFKKPPFSEGDDITFASNSTRYGMEIVEGSVVGGSSAGPRPISAASPAPTGGRGGYTPAAKPFPIPPLHGDRAIIRQNSLTNARELYCFLVGDKMNDVHEAAGLQHSADEVIKLARMFEAYSAGDLDAAAAMKESE